MENLTGFIGRRREIEQSLSAIGRGSNVLIKGRGGIGKSAFLQQLHADLKQQQSYLIWVPTGTSKQVTETIARQIHQQSGLPMPVNHLPPRIVAKAKRQGALSWSDLNRSFNRLSTGQTTVIIVNALQAKRYKVFIDSLEVPPTQAAMFAEILNHAQVIAAMDNTNRRNRIDRLLWRFQLTIELKPLPQEDCLAIAEYWLQNNPIRFSSPAVKQRFLRHIAQDSGCVPAAIRGMLEAASSENEITPAKVRAFSHEAGIRYLDMSPVLVLVVVGFMVMKYVSRGVGEIEMYVMAGVSTALFMAIRFFMYRMSR